MFRRRLMLDLLLIDGLTLSFMIMTLGRPVPFLRETLGLLLMLFFPGYVLTAALFPGKRLENAVRLALSLILSIAISVFAGLVLGAGLPGLKPDTIPVSLSLFILSMSLIAWYLRRRRESGIPGKLVLPLHDAVRILKSGGWGFRSLAVFLVFVIIGGVSSFGFVMARDPIARPYSEFYVLGPGGQAEGYPRELQADEEGQVIIGIVNHERRETVYRVQVGVDGVKLYDLPDIVLKMGEKREKGVGFTLRKAGNNQKVEFALYKADALYETRYLWVNGVR